MTFKVRWVKSALMDLTAAWLAADPATREAVTAASHLIDVRLAQDPTSEGESRANGRRIMFVPPLAVTFRVHEAKSVVRVLGVRLFKRRK